MDNKYGKLEVSYRHVADIHELPDNPRTISEKQFEILKESIIENPEFFHARPILLSNRTGELVAFAGNKRLQAAIKANMKQVPTILFENLPEEKERELAIRDNIQNGDWDKDLLIESWNDIPLIDLGLEIELTKDPFEGIPVEKVQSTEKFYLLNIRCEDEKHCQSLYEKFIKEGLDVKIIS